MDRSTILSPADHRTPIPTPPLLNEGLMHHRAGRLGEAEAAYLQLLDTDPLNAHALHYLGVLSLQRGELASAADLIDQAIRLMPKEAVFLGNRGLTAARLSDPVTAAAFYRKALALAPNFANAHNNLGNALLVLRQFDEAESHYRKALELEPRFTDALLNLGRLLETVSRREEAITCYRHAARLVPDDVRPVIKAGTLLNHARRYAEAAVCFEQAVVREPKHLYALFQLAYAYESQHRFDDALTLYRRALALSPDSAVLHNNIGCALVGLARYDEADESFRQAIRLDPALSESHDQLGMSFLRRGDFLQGWDLFEHRKTTAAGLRNYRRPAFAEWQGEPLAGKRLLLVREQGVGDQIQFIRFAPVLEQLGATIDAWVAPELAELCRCMPGINQVLTEAPVQEYDYWCHVMSVPSRLRISPIPCAPYMFADRTRADIWRASTNRLAGDARKVGLVWAGNPDHYYDAFRSLRLSALEPLAEVPGNAWFAIQKGPAQAELAGVAQHWPIHVSADELQDFADTAALIENLDLVITVDTSVAHLAGALGKPVWVLLAAQPDFRWMMSRSDSLWYRSARLFRQTTLGEWTDVVAEVGAALRETCP
ncbi:tetratricopeptide repeat protein [Paraburkholderia sediminicola]|uniref:tetratricopeptide repeat protein n=1 Tax=Paraburkholderia sediminicola TaxID=458836 RepID=UPI0038BA8553